METEEKDFLVPGEVRGTVKMFNGLALYLTGFTTKHVIDNAVTTHAFDWHDSWPLLVAGGLYAMGKIFIDNSQAKKRKAK